VSKDTELVWSLIPGTFFTVPGEEGLYLKIAPARMIVSRFSESEHLDVVTITFPNGVIKHFANIHPHAPRALGLKDRTTPPGINLGRELWHRPQELSAPPQTRLVWGVFY